MADSVTCDLEDKYDPVPFWKFEPRKAAAVAVALYDQHGYGWGIFPDKDGAELYADAVHISKPGLDFTYRDVSVGEEVKIG